MGCVHDTDHIQNTKKIHKDSILEITEKYKSKVLQTPTDLKTFKNIILPRIISNLKIDDFKLELLFQASRFQFSAKEFHKATHGIQNTIFIAKSEFGAIFGGFTPCPWEDEVMYKYQVDERNISFLFKIIQNENEKEDHKAEFYELIEKQAAILNNQEDGPVFGSGRDINIVDRCDSNECWANLGKSYSSLYKFGSNKANQLLGGSHKFRISQYEIWKIGVGVGEKVEE